MQRDSWHFHDDHESRRLHFLSEAEKRLGLRSQLLDLRQHPARHHPSEWEAFCRKHSMDQENPFTGFEVEWETGGYSGGGYSGAEAEPYAIADAKPAEFTSLRAILQDLFPELHEEALRRLLARAQSGSYVNLEWYGNRTDMSFRRISISDLDAWLKEERLELPLPQPEPEDGWAGVKF